MNQNPSTTGIARLALILLVCAAAAAAVAQTNSVVSVDTNLALVINGRKVFTIGFSPGPPNNTLTPAGKDAMQEFRDSGALSANTISTPRPTASASGSIPTMPRSVRHRLRQISFRPILASTDHS